MEYLDELFGRVRLAVEVLLTGKTSPERAATILAEGIKHSACSIAEAIRGSAANVSLGLEVERTRMLAEIRTAEAVHAIPALPRQYLHPPSADSAHPQNP